MLRCPGWRCRVIAVASLCAAGLRGQTVIDAAQVPAWADFEAHPGTPGLACQVTPFPPRIDFGFRFRSGYLIVMPAKALGEGRPVAALLRVTPESPPGAPSYLVSAARVPKLPSAKSSVSMTGGFLLGEGEYAVDLMLVDNSGGSCFKHWTAKAKRSRRNRDVVLRIPAGAVRGWSSPGEFALGRGPTARRGPRRVAVFLHAAPVNPRGARLRGFDREMLLGSLTALMEDLQPESTGLTVFNLDQQQTLLRTASLSQKDWESVGQRIRDLQLAAVDYRVLENRSGPVDLLSGLINGEFGAARRPDAIVFLGPVSRHWEKVSKEVLPVRGERDPMVFYIRYSPPYFRMGDYPDSIESMTRALRGRVFKVHDPGEFAGAVRQIREALGSR
jgi:hypothetical protein